MEIRSKIPKADGEMFMQQWWGHPWSISKEAREDNIFEDSLASARSGGDPLTEAHKAVVRKLRVNVGASDLIEKTRQATKSVQKLGDKLREHQWRTWQIVIDDKTEDHCKHNTVNCRCTWAPIVPELSMPKQDRFPIMSEEESKSQW